MTAGKKVTHTARKSQDLAMRAYQRVTQYTRRMRDLRLYSKLACELLMQHAGAQIAGYVWFQIYSIHAIRIAMYLRTPGERRRNLKISQYRYCVFL